MPKTLVKFVPVSHQQIEDKDNYVEFWPTAHNVWVLLIPVLVVAALVVAALVIL